MKKAIPFLLVFFLFGSSGCLELEELVQVKSNGAADLTLRFKIPDIPDIEGKSPNKEDEGYEKEIEELFSTSFKKGIRLKKKEEVKAYGLKIFSLEVEAENISDLRHLYATLKKNSGKKTKDKEKKDDSLKEFFDQTYLKDSYRISKTKQGTVLITRKFVPPPPRKLKKPPKKKAKGESHQAIFDNLEKIGLALFTLKFEIMVPTKVVATNAQWQYGRDLRWETTLAYLMKHPFEIMVEIEGSPELLKSLK